MLYNRADAPETLLRENAPGRLTYVRAMRLGIFTSNRDLDGFVDSCRQIAEAGFQSVWTSQIFQIDALTAIAVAAREVPEIEFGTGVVPTYPRHPMTLAIQAMTTQAAAKGRLTLGIGLSHQVVVEGMWGYDFSKPARHMREYLSALLPLLRGEAVSFEGETLKCVGQVDNPTGVGVPVVLAALAPRMLELAGSLTDGTVTWMTGPETVQSHIVPALTSAAEEAGRRAPRVVMCLPVAVTDDVDAAKERAAKTFAMYGHLPSYRAMLDKEGAAGPADVVIAGTEDEVAERVRAMASRGVTDFIATPFAEIERTMALLETLL